MNPAVEHRRVRPPGAAADALLVFTGVLLVSGLLPSLPALDTDVVSRVTRLGFEPLTDPARYAAALLSALAVVRLDCVRGYSACGRLIGELPAALTLPAALPWITTGLLLAAGLYAAIDAVLTLDLTRPPRDAPGGASALAFVPLMASTGSGVADAFLQHGAGTQLLPAWLAAVFSDGNAVVWTRAVTSLLAGFAVIGLATTAAFATLLLVQRPTWLHALLAVAIVALCAGWLVRVSAGDTALAWLLASMLGFLLACEHGVARLARLAAAIAGLTLALTLVHDHERAVTGLLLTAGLCLATRWMTPAERRGWWRAFAPGLLAGATLLLLVLSPSAALALVEQGGFWLGDGRTVRSLPFGLEGMGPGMALTPQAGVLITQLCALLVALHALRGSAQGWMRVAGLVTGLLVTVCLTVMPGIAAHSVGLAGAYALTALALPLARRLRCWLSLALGAMLAALATHLLVADDASAVIIWLARESRAHLPLHFLFWTAVHLSALAVLLRLHRQPAAPGRSRRMLAVALLLAGGVLGLRTVLERSDPEHFLIAAVSSAVLLAALLPGVLLPERVLESPRVAARLGGARTGVLVTLALAGVALLVGAAVRHVPALEVADQSLLPPQQVAAASAIAPPLAHTGCFHTLTPDGTWYPLLERPGCSRFHQVGLARTPAQQAELASALVAARPPLLVYNSAGRGDRLDGVSLFNSNAEVMARVTESFRPAVLSPPHWLWSPAATPWRFDETRATVQATLRGSVSADIAYGFVLAEEQGGLDPATHALVLLGEPARRPLWAGRIDRSPLAAYVPTAALGPGEHALSLWLLDETGRMHPLASLRACIVNTGSGHPAPCPPDHNAGDLP